MSIVANVIAAVIKSVAGDNLGNGLIKELASISIDGVSEKGINEITKFINKERSKIDSILSKDNMRSMEISEENIGYVVAEIKDLLSKINITDEVLRQCKYDNMNLSAFLWNEYKECKNDYIECEREIKRCLFTVAEALINLVYESENFEKDVLIHISNSVDDTNVELQKISEYMEYNFDKLDADNRIVLEMLQKIIEEIQNAGTKDQHKKHKVKSRTQEYADKWNANMFLNDFDKRDGDVGINVKLKDVYLEKHLPNYRWRNKEDVLETDLKDLLSEYVYNSDKKEMLLILGQPGVGKSTLITWIISNFKNMKDDILVYQFASDLKNIEICDLDKDKRNVRLGELNLSLDNLEGKILIFDGLDEINLGKDRAEILNLLYKYFIKESLLKKFSLIVTCRENYIENVHRVQCNYITLQSWKSNQIQSFCKAYSKKTKCSISDDTMKNILKNEQVLGIPLILYMVLALDISIEKEGSIVDVYDQIFSLEEGGIYERCFINIKKNKMEKYADPHWSYALKRQIHQISRNISLWMFENEPEEASIPQKVYGKICIDVSQNTDQNSKDIEQNVLVGSYFKLVRHTEGTNTEKLSFVHRSMYEYFFVEYFFDSMSRVINKSMEELAGVFGNFLKVGRLSEMLCEFMKHKIKICELRDKFDIVKDVFELMLHNGMIYYTNISYTGINYRKVTKYEEMVFVNMLDIVHLWERDSLNFSSEIIFYLTNNRYKRLNLNKVDLRGKNIKGANLERADLRGADLRGANLERVDLRGADLRKAILDENQVKHLDGVCDLYGVKIFLQDSNEIIDYNKYCSRSI